MSKDFIKNFIAIIMIFSICFSFAISSFAGYSITQITDDGNDDWDPQINRSGEVVSDKAPGNDGEIYFYNGTTITQLTDNDYDDGGARVNDSGEVVWTAYDDGIDGKIFFYDGTTITQLTDNDYYDMESRINDNGEVVWHSTYFDADGGGIGGGGGWFQFQGP